MQLRPPFTSSLLPSFSRGLFRTPVHPSASFRVLVPTTSPQPKTTTPNPHSPRHTLTLHPVPRIRKPGIFSPRPTKIQACEPTRHTASGHPIHRHSRGRNSPPYASTIDETGGRGVPTTSHRPRQIVPLRTLLSEFPSRLPPPHESPEPAHPHRLFHRPAIAPTATSVLLPSSSPGAKTHNKMTLLPSAYLRHTTGITHTKHPLRIIPPLMLNPNPQTTTQHKYLYIVNIHLITL